MHGEVDSIPPCRYQYLLFIKMICSGIYIYKLIATVTFTLFFVHRKGVTCTCSYFLKVLVQFNCKHYRRSEAMLGKDVMIPLFCVSMTSIKSINSLSLSLPKFGSFCLSCLEPHKCDNV